MPRMRILKAEFWTDSNIVQLSPYARLLYMGCWNFALCEEGHLADNPDELKMKILPADPVNADELVDELVKCERLVRGATPSGRPFLWVRKLSEHQKADTRWQSRCFVCAELRSPEPEPLPETHPNSGESHRDSSKLPNSQRVLGTGTGIGTKKDTPSRARPSPRFDEFYDLYPKRANRKAAKARWDTVTRSGVPVDDLLAGARRYAEHVRRERTETRYVKAPDVWLNKGCWDDEYETAGQELSESARIDAVLGPDRWVLPEMPAALDRDDHAALAAWRAGVRAEHVAERRAEYERRQRQAS